MRRHNAEHPARLGEHEALAFRFRNGIAEFPCSVDPQFNGFVGVRQRRFRRAAVGHATREFRHRGDEDLVLVTPVDDDLVFVLVYSFFPSSPERAMMWRT